MLFAIREKIIIIHMTSANGDIIPWLWDSPPFQLYERRLTHFLNWGFAGDICDECSFDTSCISLLSYQIILTILAKLIFSFCLCVFCIVPLWLIEDSTPTPTNFCFILLYFSLLLILFSVIQNNPGLTLHLFCLKSETLIICNGKPILWIKGFAKLKWYLYFTTPHYAHTFFFLRFSEPLTVRVWECLNSRKHCLVEKYQTALLTR